MTHLAYVRVSSYLSTAPRSASLSLASPWSSPAPEQGMMSASVYWALPYSNVSSPSTSRSASLSAALSFILHVAKPVPVKAEDVFSVRDFRSRQAAAVSNQGFNQKFIRIIICWKIHFLLITRYSRRPHKAKRFHVIPEINIGNLQSQQSSWSGGETSTKATPVSKLRNWNLPKKDERCLNKDKD